MNPSNHDRLMEVQRRVEQEWLRRLGRDVRTIDHLMYIHVYSVLRPKLNILKVKEDIGDCFICQETFQTGEEYALLPCNPTHPHKFHEACIRPWLEHHDTCPTCRGKV